MTIDIAALKARVDLPTLIGSYTKLRRDGRGWRGACPIHGGTHPNFTVSDKGTWACWSHNCHDAGSDAIAFVMLMQGIDFTAACEWLGAEREYKPSLESAPARQPQAERVTSAPPADARKPAMRWRFGGDEIEPETLREFRTADGALLGYEARYPRGCDPDTPGKSPSRYWTWGQRGTEKPGWACGQFTRPRPLYGLDRLAARPDAPVLVVEGPKAADAGDRLIPAYASVSWAGGAQAWRFADWWPLAGRRVLVWPDNDDPGRKAGDAICAVLTGLDCTVRVIDPSGQPDGWDVADWTGDGAELVAWAKDHVADYIAPQYGEIEENEQEMAESDQIDPSEPPPSDDQGAGDTAVPPKKPRARKPRLTVVAPSGDLPEDDELMPEPLSDSALARQWIARHGEDWRFVADWSSREQPCWLAWGKIGWQRDLIDAHWPLIERVCIGAANDRDGMSLTPDGRRKLCGAGKYASVSQVIRRTAPVATTSEGWDSDQWLLGIPGGYVDLRTGELHERDKSKLISLRTSVVPAQGAHPLADMVIERAAGADRDTMLPYLWRWMGYVLTGSTQLERFLYVHGPQGCGKSTLIRMIADILGDYAETINIEELVESKHARHSQGIAKLQNKRFVYASEASGAARLNESLIKWLTGRDKITAHLMRQNDVSWYPRFKLLMYGNEIPQLSGSDGIGRRLDLIEYRGTISDDERDETLKDRLVAEYPAILHDMIAACQDFQVEGLPQPDCVRIAGRDYVASQDTVGQWIEQRTERVLGARVRTSEAFKTFERWCHATGARCMSSTLFSQRVKGRGYPIVKSGSSWFEGLELLPSEDPPPNYDYADR